MFAKKYRSTIISIKNSIQGIHTLELKSLADKYKYVPGQFLHLAIDEDYDGTGQWPESRCFSVQSNPEESNIRITYAVKGKFTRQMEDKLKVGTEIWLKLPYGNLFTQGHTKINTVFIAGGTGITPFLSLFTHESFNRYLNPHIYLGFRSINFNLYNKELRRVSNPTKVLKIFYEDVDGSLNIQNIFSENSANNDYFISGPFSMISEFKKFLINQEVSKSNIKSDDWE
jgi:predicted ferric reductase